MKKEKKMTQEEYKEYIIEEFKKIWKWGHPTFYDVIIDACRIHEKKNRGYAGKRNPLANFYECEDFGVPAWKGCIVRMSDKWSRMKTLIREEDDPILIAAKKMESVEDTILDLGVYSFIELVLLREAKKKKVFKKVLDTAPRDENEGCVAVKGK